MKRFLRSLNNALRTVNHDAATPVRRAIAPVAEQLETRQLMSAALGAGAFLGKFGTSYSPSGSTIAPATSGGSGSGSNSSGGGGGGSSSSSSSSGSGDSNDRISRADSKSLNFTVSGNISYGTDVDMYKFTAKAGQRITIDIDRPAMGTLDSVVRLFNAVGQEIAISDDDAAPGEVDTLESFLDVVIPTTNTYYVGVSGAYNDDYNAVTGRGDIVGSTGRFNLIVKKYVNPDNDDALSTAETLGKNSSVTARMSTTTDVDMYRIKVSAGDQIAFDIDSNLAFPAEPLDSFLRIFNGNGVQLASNDDGDSPFEVAADEGHSYLVYTFTTAGTYYVGVSSAGNETYNAVTGGGDEPGELGRYTLYTTKLN